VDSTTALDGNDIDAVAASLIAGGPQEDEDTEEELEQAEADAQDQPETDDEAEAEEANAEEDEGADESEADAEEEEPAEQLYTVKVDGRDQQVPLSELLRGYSGQAYIQRGMKEVAEAKQQVAAVYETLASERQQLIQFAQAAQTGQMPMRPPEPPSEELLSRDPIGYLEARVKYDKEVSKFQQAQSALQEMTARQAQAEEYAHRARLADEQQRLAQAIPAFGKAETAAKVKQDLLNAGQEVYGFELDELRAVADHRMLRVLHDAAQYRRLMAGKVAEKQPTQAPKTPVIKPGVKAAPQASNRMKAEKAKSQMKRTGSVDDVARFLLM
jgi:tetratricopeptide (TPR) repeat protein